MRDGDEVKHFRERLLTEAASLEGLGWCRRGLLPEIKVLGLLPEESGVPNSQESSGGGNEGGLTTRTVGREPCVCGESRGEAKGT